MPLAGAGANTTEKCREGCGLLFPCFAWQSLILPLVNHISIAVVSGFRTGSEQPNSDFPVWDISDGTEQFQRLAEVIDLVSR